jgi:hypothetical protein
MYGKFNPDTFCRVIEKILSERDANIEVKVRVISIEVPEDFGNQKKESA